MFDDPIRVLKFGGTSVGSAERIVRVAEFLQNRLKASAQSTREKFLVVVSAMGHTTDELIQLSEQVTSVPAPTREMDMLLSSGERISMALLAIALQGRGVRAISFTGSQTGIVTDESHRRAQILEIRGDRIERALQDHDVVIVAGFQGVSRSKEITTLGRGGSDTTAVALASVLNLASKTPRPCEIFTDVRGIFSADPRLVPEAHWMPQVSVSEALELAVRGAAVLHPRALELSLKWNVPIVVRSSLDWSQEGTQVVTHEMTQVPVEGAMFRAVALDRDKVWAECFFRTSEDLGTWLRQLAVLNIAITGQRTAPGTFRGEPETWSWGAWVDHEAVGEILRERPDMMIHPTWRAVALVGSGLSQNGAIVARWIDTLQKCIGASLGPIEINAYSLVVGVPVGLSEEVVRALHQEFCQRS